MQLPMACGSGFRKRRHTLVGRLQTRHPLITELFELERIKTWSLIVTLFGDLVGEELTGTQIRTLLGHIGIKAEAIRVALHRLKSDDWITSARHGREAVYALSANGRDETTKATADVYRRDTKFPGGWHFLLTDGERLATPAGSGAVLLTYDVTLVPRGVGNQHEEALTLEHASQGLPLWVERRLVTEQSLRNAGTLADVLQRAAALDAPMQGLDRLSLRLLILHHWRRLALRPGTWAHIDLLPDAAVARCHRVVTGFLEDSQRIAFETLAGSSGE